MDRLSPSNELMEAYQTLDDSVQAAVRVSEGNIGIEVDGMTLRAYNILSRAIILGISLLNICNIKKKTDESHEIFIDHVAVASIARTMMETCLLLSYCTESDISQEEEDLRFLVFRMHDTHARYLMFKEISSFTDSNLKVQAEKERTDFRAGLDQIRAELRENTLFGSLPVDKQEGILAGRNMYTKGIRDVARKFEKMKFFNYHYLYFSSFAHCSPLSFMRIETQGISYERPSENQMNITAQAFYVSAEYLSACAERMAHLFSTL